MEKKNYAIGILNIALLCSIIATIITGCYQEKSKRENESKFNKEDLTEWTCVGDDTYIKNIVIEKHKYIIIKGTHSSNIIHSNSCPCIDIY
jgi:hypothetical protein